MKEWRREQNLKKTYWFSMRAKQYSSTQGAIGFEDNPN